MSLEFCPTDPMSPIGYGQVDEDLGADSFLITLFKDTRWIRWMHQSPPRFGHGSDMTVLIDGTRNEKEDYIIGLVATSITIFCLFLIWMIFLSVFKYMGPDRVGVLSGRRVPLPPEPPGEEEDEEREEMSGENDDDLQQQQHQQQERRIRRTVWEKQYRNTRRSDRIMKIVVVLAGIAIVIASVLLVTFGAQALLNSIDDVTETINLAVALMYRSIDLVDAFIVHANETDSRIVALVEEINTICQEEAGGDVLCTDLNDVPDSCDFDGILDGGLTQEVISFAVNGRQNLVEEFTNVKADLEFQISVAENLVNTSEDFNWALYIADIFAMMLSILCIVFLLGKFFRFPRVMRWLNNCFLVPIFVLLVTISWIFSMTFVIGSMSLADFCVDSPNENVLLILDEHQDLFSSFVYPLVVFYISGCPGSLVPGRVGEVYDYINESIQNTQRLYTLEEDSLLETMCNDRPASNRIIGLARYLSESLCFSIDLLQDLRDFMQCSNWFPLYENTVYDAVCLNGTEGFAWITVTQFVVVFMAMIILTFRVAFFNIEIEEDEGEDEDAGKKKGGNADEQGQETDDKSSSSQEDNFRHRSQPQAPSRQQNLSEVDGDEVNSPHDYVRNQ